VLRWIFEILPALLSAPRTLRTSAAILVMFHLQISIVMYLGKESWSTCIVRMRIVLSKNWTARNCVDAPSLSLLMNPAPVQITTNARTVETVTDVIGPVLLPAVTMTGAIGHHLRGTMTTGARVDMKIDEVPHMIDGTATGVRMIADGTTETKDSTIAGPPLAKEAGRAK
jgi:hypothetical protein